MGDGASSAPLEDGAPRLGHLAFAGTFAQLVANLLTKQRPLGEQALSYCRRFGVEQQVVAHPGRTLAKRLQVARDRVANAARPSAHYLDLAIERPAGKLRQLFKGHHQGVDLFVDGQCIALQ